MLLNALLKVTLAVYGVPPNEVFASDPALVFNTLLAKLDVVAYDAEVAVVAFPKNDPLNVPIDPELTVKNASITTSDSDAGA